MGSKIKDILAEKNAYRVVTLEQLMNKRVAIDAFNTLYQFLSTIRGQNGKSLTNAQGDITSHLVGAFYRTKGLLESGIRPVYVFDGVPNVMKAKELNRRKELKLQAKKELEAAEDDGDDTDTKKYAERVVHVTRKIIDDTKTLLNAMGVPYVEAAQDAESQCAYMSNKGDVWASSTQDYDAFLFGSSHIIRNLAFGKKRKMYGREIDVEIEMYSISNVIETLGITQDQLIDIGILTGVDFYEGVSGIGSKTALELITKYGSIEDLVKQKVTHRGINLGDLNIEEIRQVQEIFRHPIVNTDYHQLEWKKPDEDQLINFLITKNMFNRETMTKTIHKFVQKMTLRRQSSLDNFFPKK